MNPPKVTYGPGPRQRQVTTLLPGDVWEQSDSEVFIEEVVVTVDHVKVTGRIVKGWGKRKAPYVWTFNHDQELWVVRR